jgi:MFS transporter, DHA1 family, multidrug resistance protein
MRPAAKLQHGRSGEARNPLRIAAETRGFTALLGLFAALPALSIDISAPTLALLPQALETSRVVAGLTLSLFMVGFAAGQWSGGHLSDRTGRRPVLLAALGCFTLASIACTASTSGVALVASRLVQGLGAGACSVQSFAMVQDLFAGDAARTKRSYVAVVFGAVPILAPALGSLLIDLAGWRTVHAVLALAGAALLSVTWLAVGESRRIDRTVAAPTLGRTAARLLGDSRFVGLTLANALSYGCIFAYIAGSPVVIIAQMRLSSMVFAAIFAATAAALTAGAWTSGRLSRRGLSATTLLDSSLGVAACAAIALAAATFSGITSGSVLLPLLLLVLFARGAIAPNLQHLAIERWRDQAGTASAALGVLQLLSGALASAVVAVLLPILGASAVALPMALLAGAALIIWRWARP